MRALVPEFIVKNYLKDIVYGKFQAATLFQDISGFTAMTENLMQHGKVGAEILSQIINEVFEKVIHIIYENGGFVSTFAGDAFTAIFPSGDALRVCRTAFEIQNFFSENKTYRTKFGKFNLEVKQGLSFGRVDWGVVGGDDYKAFYFRGEAIDGCAASEHHCSVGEIVIDPRIQEKLPQEHISLKAKNDGYLLLKEIKWDKVDLTPVPSPEMTAENDETLEPRQFDNVITQKFFPALQKQEKLTAEFRDIASVFLSFDEPETFEKLDIIVTKSLKLTRDFSGYLSSLDFGDKGSIMLFLFGAPVAYEDNSLRAADFVCALKEALGDQIRVGITFGTAFAGYVGALERITYTSLGDVVNLSARFMTGAKWGQVLVSTKVAKAIEREFKVEFLEAREFKGKSGKIDVHELTERIHFEDEGLHTGHFVGRKNEIKMLKKFCKPFFDDHFSGLIYVYGAAGIGKSRLLFEFTNPLIGEEASLVVLQTDSILSKSLNPFVTYFFEYFDISQKLSQEDKKKMFDQKIDEFIEQAKSRTIIEKQEMIQKLMGELTWNRSTLAALVGIRWEGSLYEKLDPKSRFSNFLSVIKCFFLLQAYIKPLILVIEDSYDIDEDSKKALDILTSDIDEAALVIFASCRLGDDGSRPEFLTKNKDIEKKVSLSPLSNEDSRELVESLLNKPVHDNLSQFIIEKTENNPLYIEEFCGYLLENKLIKEQKGQYFLVSKEADMPEGISSIMVSRIDRLPNDLRKAVQTAAVLGREFNISILEQLLKENELSLETLLDEGVKQNIWEKLNEKHYQFIQSMIQNAAYSMQLTEDLKIIHRKAGELSEEYYRGDTTRLANIGHHFQIAEVKDKAIEYLNKASKLAHDSYRSDEALELYEKLLVLMTENEEKVKIYGRMAEIQELTGLWDEAFQLLMKGITMAQKIGVTLQVANLQGYLGEILQKKGDTNEAIAALESAIEISIEHADKIILAKSYLNMGRVYWSKGKLDKAVVYLEKAFDYKSEIQDQLGKALSLYYIGVIRRDQNQFDAALKYYKRSQKIFETVHNKRYIAYPVYGMGVIYQYSGELDKSEKLFNKCIKIYREIGYRSGEAATLRNLGVVYCMRGDYERALNIMEDSLKITQDIDEKLAISYTFFIIGVVFDQLDKYKEKMEYFEKALKLMREIKARGRYGNVFAYLVCSYAKSGHFDQAIKVAYYHVNHIKRVKVDAENGRTYLGIALVLAYGKELSKVSQKRLSEIEKFTHIQKSSPQAFFELAIATSQKVNYIRTLVPALYEYARYLILKEDKQSASKYLNEAKTRAQEAGLINDLKEIDSIAAL